MGCHILKYMHLFPDGTDTVVTLPGPPSRVEWKVHWHPRVEGYLIEGALGGQRYVGRYHSSPSVFLVELAGSRPIRLFTSIGDRIYYDEETRVVSTQEFPWTRGLPMRATAFHASDQGSIILVGLDGLNTVLMHYRIYNPNGTLLIRTTDRCEYIDYHAPLAVLVILLGGAFRLWNPREHRFSEPPYVYTRDGVDGKITRAKGRWPYYILGMESGEVVLVKLWHVLNSRFAMERVDVACYWSWDAMDGPRGTMVVNSETGGVMIDAQR